MAKIANRENGLSLEVRFRAYRNRWVLYHFYPRWRGEPVFNTGVIQASFRLGRHPHGALTCEHFMGDSLLTMIRGVLDSGLPDAWTPDEPDLDVTILPPGWDDALRALKALASHDAGRRKRARIPVREATSRRATPNDEFILRVALDGHALEMKGIFYGPALSFEMATTRKLLEKFHSDLSGEYEIFRRRFTVPAPQIKTAKKT